MGVVAGGAVVRATPTPATGDPHALQNAAPSATFAPHFEQNIEVPFRLRSPEVHKNSGM
jgi:hypothetical protein